MLFSIYFYTQFNKKHSYRISIFFPFLYSSFTPKSCIHVIFVCSFKLAKSGGVQQFYWCVLCECDGLKEEQFYREMSDKK